MILHEWTIASNGDHVRIGVGSDVAVLRVSPQDNGTYRAAVIGEDPVRFTDLDDARNQLDARAFAAGFAFEADTPPLLQAVLDAADRYNLEMRTTTRYPEWREIYQRIVRHHINTLRSPS